MSNNNAMKTFLFNKLKYIQTILKNTIISIKRNQQNRLFSDNDKNLSITILIELYQKTDEIEIGLNSTTDKEHIEHMISNLQKVIDKLSVVICGFGTQHIEEMLFISFGTEFRNMKFTDETMKDKYDLIVSFFKPTGYKIQSWKTKKYPKISQNAYCIDKITEDTIEIEQYNNIECLNNIDESEDSVFQHLNSIKCIIQNDKIKKSMIISGTIDDFPVKCLTVNKYIVTRYNNLKEIANNYDDSDTKETFMNVLKSLSLKELLIYGDNDIIKNVMLILKDIEYVKKTHIDSVVKKFLEYPVLTKRKFILNLLSYKNDSDIQYICYILYDLINVAGIAVDNETEGAIIYNSFPWYIKEKFKQVIKLNIKNNQENSQKYESNKLTLEQQIHMLKVDSSIKDKAISKLNEMKGKPDEMTMKTKQYLEGLVKIPFSTYYEEPIIKTVKDNNQNFVNLISNYSNIFDNINIANKKQYTNVEIKNYINILENDCIDNFKKISIMYMNSCTLKELNSILNYIYIKIKHSTLNIDTLNKKTKSSKYEYICNYINKCINNIYDVSDVYNEMLTIKQKPKITLNKDICTIKSNISIISDQLDYMSNTLNESIHGHNNAKNQIMKIIGQWMNGEREGYSFGFEGSPGIGKTSLASKGLTQCLKDKDGNTRPFTFIALGGSSNGSFLEGHGYTYMNSTWGKIVDILIDSKCMNPIIYVDELDKVSKTEQGKEIIGILTHLIDPTQNKNFQDKYFTGINIDVSKVLFIFSYNDAEQIDKILLDRIHRIKFKNLSLEEKIVIVNKYILPEINKKMGFEEVVHITDECIQYIIESYTLEPGVRKLKEILFDLYGEINLLLLKEENITYKTPLEITIEELEEKYMTKYTKIKQKIIHSAPEIGTINGLWANSLGCGGITPIQTLFYPSPSFLELQLTGLQGDVMKESMNVAKSLAWNLTNDNTKHQWLEYFKETKCQGLHIHCPEGGISKDGPSAGAAITTAIYSLLNKKKIKNTVAITGEITLNGDVTAIGGLDIKISHGIKAGVTTFLYPKDNNREHQLWYNSNKDITENIQFIEVDNIHQIFEHVFL